MANELMAAAAEAEWNDGYPEVEALIRRRVAFALQEPLFLTGVKPLFPEFLRMLPESRRQHYKCSCCRRFFERYGGLVTIDKLGETWPLLWGPGSVPRMFQEAFARVWQNVKDSKVVGQFLWSEEIWGTPVTGDWTHLSGQAGRPALSATLTAEQVAAQRLEDFKMLKHALGDYGVEVARTAVRILEADALDRSEKTVGVAKWFLALHQEILNNRARRDNIVWTAVATAPPGFCHVRSTMISTLLDDIKEGVGLDVIAARWAKKMHPLQYQRVTSELKEGQVRAANAFMEKLASAGSLARRFARRSDITYRIWEERPLEATPLGGGVFDHLLPKAAEIELPGKTLTWVKFLKEVLPRARKIELRVPSTRSSFAALVTAANPEAPPLLQWSNHVSWYLYHQGSHATDWGLIAGSWEEVPVVTCLPCHWEGGQAHQGEGIILVLPRARDLRHKAGGGWFSECLRSEYHGVRAAMEHYANSAAIAGRELGDACGLLLPKGQSWNAELRVHDGGGTAVYKLDRWD